MAETSELPLKIENNTARVILLFPTDSFPEGIKLVPGLNTVPALYMEEFKGREVATESRAGKPGKSRFPGREVLEQLKEPVRIVTKDGIRIGPQITVYEDQQVGREDGTPPPQSLKGLNDIAAEKIIEITSDRKALKRWAEEGGAHASKARTRLVTL